MKPFQTLSLSEKADRLPKDNVQALRWLKKLGENLQVINKNHNFFYSNHGTKTNMFHKLKCFTPSTPPTDMKVWEMRHELDKGHT